MREDPNEKGVLYLSENPVSISLQNGAIVWLTCRMKLAMPAYQFAVDNRSKIEAVPVESLPKEITRKLVPDVCKSRNMESITDV